jgi:hypothetical protein
LTLQYQGREKTNYSEQHPGKNIVDEKTVETHHERFAFESDNSYDELHSGGARQTPAKILNFFELSFTEPFVM